MTEPRPKTLTSEMRLGVAKEIADDLVKAGKLTADQIPQAVADIARQGERHLDGYEIAKRLDQSHHWDCDLEMANILDAFSTLASSQIRTAEKEWFARNDIKPPLQIGARIKSKCGSVGTIDGVYDYGPAKYTMIEDGDVQAKPPTNRRLIVNFEDAEEIKAAA